MNYLQNNLLSPIFLTIRENSEIQLLTLVPKLILLAKEVVYCIKPKPFPNLLPKSFLSVIPKDFLNMELSIPRPP